LGDFGGSWACAGSAGPFSLILSYSPVNSGSHVGGRLTWIKKQS